MTDYIPYQQLGISLLLGLLVGLQRERSEQHLAGLRTFPLITILGTLLALLDGKHAGGGWILAAGLVVLTAVLVLGNLLRPRQPNGDPGITTETAALVMFAVGAYLVLGDRLVAIAVGGGVAVLLQFKPEIHGFAARLADRDVRAIMQFVLIACIILPVVPNRTYGPPPLDVLNPFNVWLMVVLIVGISLGGYLVYKFVPKTTGVLVVGLLGGAISSTATTASYARRASREPNGAWLAALVIAVASAVMYVRVLVLAAVVAPEFFAAAAAPVGIVLLASVAAAIFGWSRTDTQQAEMPEVSNPTEMRAAVVIALMYAVVLVALAAARQYLGQQGLYLVAGLSGLTDVDAITLSTAQLARDGQIAAGTAWRMILVATIANFAFKTGMVAALGNRRLLLCAAVLFAAPVATAAVVIAAGALLGV